MPREKTAYGYNVVDLQSVRVARGRQKATAISHTKTRVFSDKPSLSKWDWGHDDPAINAIAVDAAEVVFDQIEADAATPLLGFEIGRPYSGHFDIIDDGGLVVEFDFDEMVVESAKLNLEGADDHDGVAKVRKFAEHLRDLADRLDGMAIG